METKQVIITPALAAEWLMLNRVNRPLRPSTVAGFKLSFERGEYQQTHQGIAFDEAGHLIDGQHRLTAISQMPETFKVQMLVTKGLPRSAFNVMDIGLKRSVSDILDIPQGLAAVARFLATFIENNRSAITPTMLADYVDGVRDAYARLVDYAPTVQKTWSSSAVRSAAILRMVSGGDADYVMLSYHALLHSEYDSMSRIVQALNRQQTAGKVRGSLELFQRSYRAFDIKRHSLDTIQISDPRGIMAEAREMITTFVLKQSPAPTQKKAAPVSAAKKANTFKFSAHRVA